MKRQIALILVLVLVLFAVACDGGTTDDPRETTGGGEALSGDGDGTTGEGGASSDDATTEGRYKDEEPVLWDGSVAEGFAGGTGSESDPYLISSGAELAYLAKTVNDGSAAGYAGKYFRLTANIDLGGIEWDPIGCYHRDETLKHLWHAFCGFFDGDAYVVSNLRITALAKAHYNYAGLFGYVHEDTEIRDLCVRDVEIDVTTTDSKDLYVGGLVASSRGLVSGCYVSGSVRGYNDYKSKTETSSAYVGGLAGAAWAPTGDASSVFDCGADATVCAKGATSAYAGGLLGNFSYGSVSSCYATGSVEALGSQKRIEAFSYTAYVRAGGLIATASGGSLTDSYATGDVRVGAEYKATVTAGGLVGQCKMDSVVDCYAEGGVSAEHYGVSYCGGLIGSALNITPMYEAPEASEIRDCRASGDVSAVTESLDPTNPSSSIAGGLVGSFEGAVIRCFAEGDASALGDGYQSAAGGLVGELLYGLARLESSYALGGVESDNYAGGLVGKTEGDVTVIYCYAVGNVSAGDEGGALVGHDGCDGDSTHYSACFATGDVDAGNRVDSVIPSGFGNYESLYYLEDQTLVLGGTVVTERYEYEPGDACTAAQLSDAAFYTDTLGWSADVWELTGLDAANGKLPTLRPAE